MHEIKNKKSKQKLFIFLKRIDAGKTTLLFLVFSSFFFLYYFLLEEMAIS